MEQEKMKNLIGRKVKGFIFENGTDRISYQTHMELYIGEVGLIICDIKDGFIVKFQDNNTYCYPSSLIEQHIVEENISEDFVDSFKYAIYGLDYTKSEVSEIEQLKAENAELLVLLKDFIHAIDSDKVILASEYEQAKQLIEKHEKND